MFFLLKCGVWLAIVYAAILYGIGPLGRLATDQTRQQATHDVAQADRTPSVVGGWVDGRTSPNPCAMRRAECLADAARLTALLESSLRSDPGEPPKTSHAERPRKTDVSSEAGTIPRGPLPMPVPDPRRRVVPSRLSSKS